MDIGGWRDMHRHRRCQQVQQNFTTIHGYEVPPILAEAGVEKEYRQAMDAVQQDIEGLRKDNQEAALYAIPFGFRVRCLFKMDFAEVEYISKPSVFGWADSGHITRCRRFLNSVILFMKDECQL
jgi:hypothetical protein